MWNLTSVNLEGWWVVVVVVVVMFTPEGDDGWVGGHAPYLPYRPADLGTLSGEGMLVCM